MASWADNVSRSKDVRWYQSKLGSNLTPAGRALLQDYGGIPDSEIEAHIYQVRDSAWEIFPWPCIGGFWFITLGLSQHPKYNDLLIRLRTQDPPTKLLDLGTCLGQDLRKLVADGVPVQALWGSDYFPAFEGAGHELFRDANKFQNRFIAADLFDESKHSELEKTAGSWDVINMNMILHMWDWPTQVRACKRVLKLLSKKKGSIVIGLQSGSTTPGDLILKPPVVREGDERKVYRHSKETFEKMWSEVGNEESLDLKIEVEYEEQAQRDQRSANQQAAGKKPFFSESTERRLFFLITLK